MLLNSVEEQWLLTRKDSYLVNQNALSRYTPQLNSHGFSNFVNVDVSFF